MCGGGKLLQNTDCWAPGWAPPPPPPPRSSADVAQASAQRTFRRLRKAQDPRLNLGDFLLRAGTTGLRFVQWRPGSMASLEGQRSWCPHNPLTFSLCPRGQPRLSSIFQRFSAPGTGNFQVLNRRWLLAQPCGGEREAATAKALLHQLAAPNGFVSSLV